MQIGENIKRLRELKKWTQKDICEKLGITRGQIGNYENGRNLPSVDIIYKLCEILDTSPNVILGYEDKSQTPPPQPKVNEESNNSFMSGLVQEYKDMIVYLKEQNRLLQNRIMVLENPFGIKNLPGQISLDEALKAFEHNKGEYDATVQEFMKAVYEKKMNEGRVDD